MFSCLKEVTSAFSKSRWFVIALAATILTGCDLVPVGNVEAFEKERPKSAEVLGQPVSPAWYGGELPILRFQVDSVRKRGWVLTPEGVHGVNINTRQSTGLIPLPGWQWVGEEFSCLPALALGPKGEALITSNVVATLWRIDPETLAVSKHEPVLDADTDKDVGFTGLAYSVEDEAFFAVSDFGALWRIDPLFRQAQKIRLLAPIPKACGVAIRTTASRYFGLCIHGRQDGWTVDRVSGQQGGWIGHPLPGGRSGRAFARSCTETPSPSLVGGNVGLVEMARMHARAGQ
jgi:hypothetical protein